MGSPLHESSVVLQPSVLRVARGVTSIFGGDVRMGVPVDFTDGLNYSNYADQDYWSELTDSENDEEYGCTPKAFERHLPRCFKRTYGVLFEGAVVSERRSRSKIDEQFEQLRTVLPYSCTDEKVSILTDAYEYIEKLERQVEELHCELDAGSCAEYDLSCCDEDLSPLFKEGEAVGVSNADFDVSSQDDLSCFEEDLIAQCREGERAVESNAGFSSSSGSHCGCLQPTVEIVRTEKGLEIHIECDKKPGLLMEIMEVLESSGLIMEQANIDFEESLVFDGIGSEVEGNDSGESRHATRVSAEILRASLRSLIADQRQNNAEREV